MCSSTSPPTMCAPRLLRTSRPTGPATRNSMPAATFSCSEHSKIPSVMAPWRSSGSQHVADPAHNVVPPVRYHLDSQVSKVGLLGGQEPPKPGPERRPPRRPACGEDPPRDPSTPAVDRDLWRGGA